MAMESSLEVDVTGEASSFDPAPYGSGGSPRAQFPSKASLMAGV